jgi:hypothetical protein
MILTITPLPWLENIESFTWPWQSMKTPRGLWSCAKSTFPLGKTQTRLIVWKAHSAALENASQRKPAERKVQRSHASAGTSFVPASPGTRHRRNGTTGFLLPGMPLFSTCGSMPAG